MAEETTRKPKTGMTFDSAYGFSFSIAVGLALFIAGLVITLRDGTSIGLIFGIPLLLAGLVIPIFMMRDLFTTNEINAPCPNCGTTIRTSDATLRLKCPGCSKVIDIRDEKLLLAEEIRS